MRKQSFPVLKSLTQKRKLSIKLYTEHFSTIRIPEMASPPCGCVDARRGCVSNQMTSRKCGTGIKNDTVGQCCGSGFGSSQCF